MIYITLSDYMYCTAVLVQITKGQLGGALTNLVMNGG